MDSHRKGDLTEAIVIAELKRRSIPVSISFDDNERYDLVLETPEGGLIRVQVKSGWLSGGKVEFHARSQHTNSQGNVYKSYDGDIDYYVVYCHGLETLYLIREDEFGGSISLRVEEPKIENRRINWARDFEFDDRWPPGTDEHELAVSQRDSITKVIQKLTSQDVAVANPVSSNRYQLIIEASDGEFQRMQVKSGWIDNGRIRYNHEPISDQLDYFAIYIPGTAKLYIVPRCEFESSIVLRVDDPKKNDSRINWAEDYEFPGDVPWE